MGRAPSTLNWISWRVYPNPNCINLWPGGDMYVSKFWIVAKYVNLLLTFNTCLEHLSWRYYSWPIKVVVVIAPDYQLTEWCNYELQHVLQQSSMGGAGLLIPILCGGCRELLSTISTLHPLSLEDPNWTHKLRIALRWQHTHTILWCAPPLFFICHVCVLPLLVEVSKFFAKEFALIRLMEYCMSSTNTTLTT